MLGLGRIQRRRVRQCRAGPAELHGWAPALAPEGQRGQLPSRPLQGQAHVTAEGKEVVEGDEVWVDREAGVADVQRLGFDFTETEGPTQAAMQQYVTIPLRLGAPKNENDGRITYEWNLDDRENNTS